MSFKRYSISINLGRTEDDYLLTNQNDTHNDVERDFEDDSEDIRKVKWDKILMFLYNKN